MKTSSSKTASILTANLVLGCCLILSSCSTLRPTHSGSSTNDMTQSGSRVENLEFEAIEKLYHERNFESALKRSKLFINKHPKSPILDQVHNIRGLAYLGLKQYQFALINFKHAAETTQSATLKSMSLYNQAFVENELGQTEAARDTLENIKTGALANSDRSKYFILSAKVERSLGDFSASTRSFLNAVRYMPDQVGSKLPGESSAHTQFLSELLQKIESPSFLDQLMRDFDDSPLLDHVYHRAIALSVNSSDLERARALSEKLLSQFPQSIHATFAREYAIDKTAQDSGPIESRKIGVILTLSGKFGKFGQKALQGIQLATKNLATIIVKDDQGDPQRARDAVDELVKQEHVVAIIGPLVSKLADPVAKRSQELAVPLMTLTQKEVNGMNFVYNAALTPAMQVRELMRYAHEKAGIQDFAILAPNSRFGEEYAKAFWDAIDAKEKRVTGYETYPETETDFRNHIDNLVGLSFTEARNREVAELQLMKQNANANSSSKLSNKRLNKMFTLKPIVDFQAIFIPDEPKSLGQILPTFAYRDVEKMLYLGINTWNNNDLLARAGTYAEGAVFVDAFFSGTQNVRARQFIEDYKAQFNSEPSSIEATSYDAAKLIVSQLIQGINSRSELRDRINGLRDFPGIMGNISYLDGKITKHLAILTVKGGKIEEVAQE